MAHLRRLRSQEKDGEAKYDRLMRDMMQMEVHLQYKILPDEAKDSKKVAVFSAEEKIADLQENSKYFKHNNRQSR